MMNQIVPQLWMMVPKEERDFIAQAFEIKRTGITEIVNQDVVTDGYTAEDLKAITIEKMTEFIGSQESFMRAWELTIGKAHAELNPPAGIIMAKLEVIEQEIKQEVSKVEEAVSKKLKKGK